MINISRLYCEKQTFSDRLRYHKNKNFGPVAVYNCTAKCNLNCRHCYSFQQQSHNTELSTQQAKELLTQLKQVNCPVVLFSGGEPLLRTDILELIQQAKRLNLRAVLSTNGTLIDKSTAKQLKQTGLSYAGISIDGTEEYHNKFRCSEDAFQMAIEGIKNCVSLQLKAGIRFTITKDNFQQIQYIFELAQSLGVRRICFYHLVNTPKASQQKMRPAKEQTSQAVDTIIENTRKYVSKGILDEVLTVANHADGAYLLYKMENEQHSYYEQARSLLQLKSANANGKGITCINWDGTVFIDQFTRNLPLGNIIEQPFEQIWYNNENPILAKLRERDFYPDKRCLNCRFTEICRSNPHIISDTQGEKSWQNEPPCYLDDKIIES